MTRHLVAAVIIAIALAGLTTAGASAQAGEANHVIAPNPPTPLFTAFFTELLAGKVPSVNLTPQVKAGLTPTVLTQIDGLYSNFGAFKSLQFVSSDTVQGYQRYHYKAIFEKSTQGVMFVTDASGAIAGFFVDQQH